MQIQKEIERQRNRKINVYENRTTGRHGDITKTRKEHRIRKRKDVKPTSLGDRRRNGRITERHRSGGKAEKHKDMKSGGQNDKMKARQRNKETESYENLNTENME